MSLYDQLKILRSQLLQAERELNQHVQRVSEQKTLVSLMEQLIQAHERLHSANTGIEHMRKLIGEKDSEIASLREQLRQKEQQVCSSCDTLKDQVKDGFLSTESRDDHLVPVDLNSYLEDLLDKVPKLSTEHKDALKPLIYGEVWKTVKDQQTFLVPCYKLGMHIVARKLQTELPTNCRTSSIRDRGNAAAHHGTCVASASVFQKSPFGDNEPGALNEQAFKRLYGVSPSFVWTNRGCKKLTKVINWRALMWVARVDDAYSFKEFEAMFTELRGILVTYSMAQIKQFFSEEHNDRILKEMEAMFDKAYNIHKRKERGRKR